MPATFGGVAVGFLRRISGCVGAFASYVRSARATSHSSACSAEPSHDACPMSSLRKCSVSALFPLPLVSEVRKRLPPNGRSRRRIANRAAVVQLQNAKVLFLNFEAAGRRREYSRAVGSTTPAQQRALAGIADAAKAMLCPDVLRGSLKTLGLRRGKIAAGWDSLAAIRHSVRLLETDTAHQQYRVSVPLGVAAGAAADEAVDVDIQRVKLPEQAATVHLERFLIEPTVRESFLHPSTLADATKEPFTGRVCDRVPRAERAAFLRALDRAGMLAAMRARLGKRSGFFAVRKQWDPERPASNPRRTPCRMGQAYWRCTRSRTKSSGFSQRIYRNGTTASPSARNAAQRPIALPTRRTAANTATRRPYKHYSRKKANPTTRKSATSSSV